MNLLYGSSPNERNMALEGWANLLPLHIAAAVILATGYISSLCFHGISNSVVVQKISWFGAAYIPAVRSAIEFSVDPLWCSFDMRIQWILLFCTVGFSLSSFSRFLISDDAQP